MKTPRTLQRIVCLAAWAALLAAALAGCSTSRGPRLRITNSGATAIENLTVIFPEDRIAYGDVAPGATTEYRDVPNGVYQYAAYSFDLNGETVTQPVLDWVGEEPMAGTAFTYTLDFDPSRPALQMIQLMGVTEDE